MIKFKLSKDVTGKNVELEYNLPTNLVRFLLSI